MRIDIRIAGLPAQVESRIRLAAQLIAAYDINARVSAWDGTRCHALVADAEDAYGARSIELAARRGIAVLALSGSGTNGPDDSCKSAREVPAASLAKVMAQCLAQKIGLAAANADAFVPGPAGTIAAAADAGDDCGLLQLATVPALAQGDLVGRCDGLTVLLRREASRASAASRDELLAARDRLAQPGWTFTLAVHEHHDLLLALAGAGMALDAFCVGGALAADAALPALPAQALQLQDWPDLGSAATPPAWLRAIGLLQQAPQTPAQLAARSGLAPAAAQALLWALRASGAVVPATAAVVALAADPAAAPAPRIAPGLLSKLMRRFGLALAS